MVRIDRDPFGTLPDGRQVERLTLVNARGMTVGLISYGAAIQSLLVPDRAGRFADVTLGHGTLRPYLDQPQYFGATVGRVANRIAGGRFEIDGHIYRVPANHCGNALHGGPEGFDKRNWTVAAVEADAVTFALTSPDGDQGFPGTLRVTARYALSEDDVLTLDYVARTDRPTIVNLSNHAYWNLAGEGSAGGAMDHVLTIPADHYLPTDEEAIPTGELRPVDGTPFDFRTPRAVAGGVRDASDAQIRIGRGYDHNMVVDRAPAAEPRLLARVEDPGSGRAMELLSTAPGVQFYSGNVLDGTSAGKSGRLYRQGDSVVLEPQMFPDTANRPHFGSIRLDPGDTYRHRILWRFSAR
ncbi:MAG: aldose epimerase family protein [Allosphingosinicella sp.]|uniref:aldose epimerase family protein n=1 Tax=Allosphingosinicella sp. TaxID=2823234 RepID=UPI0039308C0E